MTINQMVRNWIRNQEQLQSQELDLIATSYTPHPLQTEDQNAGNTRIRQSDVWSSLLNPDDWIIGYLVGDWNMVFIFSHQY